MIRFFLKHLILDGLMKSISLGIEDNQSEDRPDPLRLKDLSIPKVTFEWEILLMY